METFFAAKYSFSPYRACEHACKYCDGRAEKYYVDGDFEKDIGIRKNAAELLQKELPKLREPGIIIIGSGISDPYQPVEAEEKIMQDCAQILAGYHFPVTVMTKSALIMRDIDIWQEVHRKNGFTLMVSLVFSDDSLRQLFEPFAASVKSRLDTLRAFKEKGMNAGVIAMPFLPYLADTRENISCLAKNLKDIGVDFVIPAGLTLRPGRQKDVYLAVIEENFPDLRPKYEILYGQNRASGISIYGYREKFLRTVDSIFSEHRLLTLVPHYV
ncbi:MAG: radical SAM protein, partial [bacterium]|nr:radical SAM protein [bacterium]